MGKFISHMDHSWDPMRFIWILANYSDLSRRERSSYINGGLGSGNSPKIPPKKSGLGIRLICPEYGFISMNCSTSCEKNCY